QATSRFAAAATRLDDDLNRWEGTAMSDFETVPVGDIPADATILDVCGDCELFRVMPSARTFVRNMNGLPDMLRAHRISPWTICRPAWMNWIPTTTSSSSAVPVAVPSGQSNGWW